MSQSNADEFKAMAQENVNKMKAWFGDQKSKLERRITMEGILKQARESFEFFLESGAVPIEKDLCKKLMRDAYGIVFLSELRVGVLAGGKIGTGILITRMIDNEDEWSGPIAIGTGGVSFGFQAGVSKTDHIILLPSPNHIKAFIGKGQLQLNGNVEATVANYGRDANVGVAVNDKGNAAPIVSYSFGVKGLYAGVSVSGAALLPRSDCNARFYRKQVTLEQIVNGLVDAPDLNTDYKKIIDLLDEHTCLQIQSTAEGCYRPPSLANNHSALK